MKNTDAAWLAGLIDGEGCFHIRKSKADGIRVSPHYRFFLLITMGCESTIKHVKLVTEAGFITTRRPSNGCNQSWTWWCGASEVAAIIDDIRPYLVTKAMEADIALRFLALPRTVLTKGSGHRFIRTPPDIVAKRDSIWDEMRRAKPTFRFRAEKERKLNASHIS